MTINILGQRDILLLFAKLFSKHGVSYILTGSFAVSYYGYPRATHDIDFVIEIPFMHTNKLINALEELPSSFLSDYPAIEDAVKRAGQFNILHLESGIKLDFWVISKDEFEQNKFKRKKTVVLNGQKIYIVSVEDLILTKLFWCKKIRSERHMMDCVGIWKMQEGKLDMEYLDRWIRKLKLGELFKEVKTGKYD